MKWLPLLLLMSGCAFLRGELEAKPYLETGLAVQWDHRSDWFLHRDRDWTCDPPRFNGRVGVEWPQGWRVSLNHYSSVLCGTHNDKPEIYSNEFEVSYKFGGVK